jgi:Lrp/AsnC family leucine-responsive transcriptional regulator
MPLDQLDDIDLEILRLLQQDGRISNTDLAQQVGLTPPTVLRRVKLLEERGYIRGYTALLDPLQVGLPVTGFIFVETVAGCDLDDLAGWLAQLPEVQEAHRVIGQWCFLLKVRTRTPQHLEELLHRTLRQHHGIRRTETTLATSSVCEARPLPLVSPSKVRNEQ